MIRELFEEKSGFFLSHFKILAGLRDVAYTVTVVRVRGNIVVPPQENPHVSVA